MYLEKYTLESEENFTRFEFKSEGPKGVIKKRIEFQKTTEPDTYNLAFGDIDPLTGTVHDRVVSNNLDTEKILATVVAAVYVFFDHHPTAYLYAQGSTKSRTRRYRMGMNRYLPLIQQDFYLYGRLSQNFVPFLPNVEYDGFLAQRRFS